MLKKDKRQIHLRSFFDLLILHLCLRFAFREGTAFPFVMEYNFISSIVCFVKICIFNADCLSKIFKRFNTLICSFESNKNSRLIMCKEKRVIKYESSLYNNKNNAGSN